jgi:hypothetical protein
MLRPAFEQFLEGSDTALQAAAALGVDVRGRSQTLKVNYRTSHQIREAADRLLPKVVRDVDGLEEERSGLAGRSGAVSDQITL